MPFVSKSVKRSFSKIFSSQATVWRVTSPRPFVGGDRCENDHDLMIKKGDRINLGGEGGRIGQEREGPAGKLVSRGKGLCGVREDSDCSAEVCIDPVVGTNGVVKG